MPDRVQEFVLFDADGAEVDWIDPYRSHRKSDRGAILVSNGYDEYQVWVPPGGYFRVRPRCKGRLA